MTITFFTSGSINFNKYVDITSYVAAPALVQGREFIGRIYDTNTRIPPNTVVEMTTLRDVVKYFGQLTVEYQRAYQYFNWVSKAPYTQPQKISFYQWPVFDTSAQIYGSPLNTPLAQFQTIIDGSFGLTLNSITLQLASLDFSGATSFGDIATILQTAIRAASADPAWTGAIVSYMPSGPAGAAFNFIGGISGTCTLATQMGITGTDIQTLLGWNPVNPLCIISPGVEAQSLTECLNDSVIISNNFGSFVFIDTTGPLNVANVTEIAVWNDSQDVSYIYNYGVTLSNYASYQASVANYKGIALTIDPGISGQFPDQEPMQIFAATDYTRPNAVQNYMYQQDPNLSPSVLDLTTAELLDAVNVNYYGRTQTNGQYLDFYQNGVLQGTNIDPIGMNVYANEVWLRNSISTNLIELQLSLREIPANLQGQAQIISGIQQSINQALINGTISVNKILTQAQILQINNITGDPNAWSQVQGIGYWLSVTVNATTQIASYTLVYSKDDVILSINGTHDLI